MEAMSNKPNTFIAHSKRLITSYTSGIYRACNAVQCAFDRKLYILENIRYIFDTMNDDRIIEYFKEHTKEEEEEMVASAPCFLKIEKQEADRHR